ncbi:MAG TPA: rRNA maturation RNase YbeY [Fulvivirga sp.]|nr:rRNA maturation RNase YbeY [Fulvivirga sp.]
MSQIHFFEEGLNFKLDNEEKIIRWLDTLIKTEGFYLEELNYIFCSDDHLHKINLEYLNHDTLTDIITFDNSEEDLAIEADVFISIDRVRENERTFDSGFEKELSRVIVHGLLHLFGYDDKTEEQKQAMRKKEEACLSLLPN